MAAAALLAVSAGACVGVALSPAVSSLYAPAAVRPITSQVTVMQVPRTQMQAVNAPYGAEYAAAQIQTPVAQSSSVTGWTAVSAGLFAAAAAMAAVVFKGSRAETSEQLAMMATAGKKKSAPKAAAKGGERPLWYPSAEAPEWLDGSLPGDRGFDPWGLAAPKQYIQVDFDGQDQNLAKNPAGKAIGAIKVTPDQVAKNPLVPYSDVYGIQRFRECELQNGRWAMLAVLGCLVGEAVTGIEWQNVGYIEATQGYTYFNNPLPFTGSQITWFEVLSMGFVEVLRNTELDPEKRSYPGGAFDPLGLASKDAETTFRLKEAELKHGRLAMIAFLGFAVAAGKTGAGATTAFSVWATNFAN